jgi:hypothetical protein
MRLLLSSGSIPPTPLYEDLDRVKHEISDNREQLEGSVAQLRILEKAEMEQQKDNQINDDEWEFMDSSWTPAQLSQASKNIQKACIAIRRANPTLSLLDIVIGKAKETIDWTQVCADTDHEPVETRVRITSMWKENQIEKQHKTKEVTEARQKSLEANRKICIAAIAKADVTTADSMEANRIEGVTSKAPQLVLQANAIIGDKASPKVLIQLMKAMTTYFDQTPGTFRDGDY